MRGYWGRSRSTSTTADNAAACVRAGIDVAMWRVGAKTARLGKRRITDTGTRVLRRDLGAKA